MSDTLLIAIALTIVVIMLVYVVMNIFSQLSAQNSAIAALQQIVLNQPVNTQS